MRILSRHELLQLTPEQLRGTAECHGLIVDDIADSDLVDHVDDWLSDLRALAMGDSE